MRRSIKFVIFEKVTGEIIRFGKCPEGDVKNQHLEDGQGILQGTANDVEDKIIEGEVVRRSEEEIVSRKEQFLPTTLPEPDQPAMITRRELRSILTRLKALESKQPLAG